MNVFPLPEFLIKIIVAFMIFLAPLYDVMLAITVLIVVDAFTGIWASNIKGERFSSSKFFQSIVKLIIYLVLIMVSHLVEIHLLPELPILKLSIWFVSITEFSSFLENTSIISGRDVIGFFKEQLSKFKPVKDK